MGQGGGKLHLAGFCHGVKNKVDKPSSKQNRTKPYGIAAYVFLKPIGCRLRDWIPVPLALQASASTTRPQEPDGKDG